MAADPGKLTVLAVELRGRRIGIINRLPGDKHLFVFEQEYVDDPGRPTLSLSYKSRSGGLMTAVRAVPRRVPPFFSNLLPEGHLRKYLAERAGVNPEREFFLLAALGADLAGAVTVTPLNPGGPADHSAVDERSLDRQQERRGALRFSLAGVQLKFSAVMESSGGLTIPAEGVGGSWIVKLPSMNFASVVENEFVMLELARSIGSEVPQTQLVPVNAIQGLPADVGHLGSALAVERFDRGPGQRIHMEDLAQVFGIFPEGKYKSVSYANIARVLWAETGEQGTYEFVKRLAFSVLIGNGDMHLKNWSMLYPDGRTPMLSPVYDFVATLPYIPGDSLALTFGGSRSLEGIDFDQLRRFSDTAGLPLAPIVRIVRETAESTAAAWKTLRHKELLPADILQMIDRQIHRASARTLEMLSYS